MSSSTRINKRSIYLIFLLFVAIAHGCTFQMGSTTPDTPPSNSSSTVTPVPPSDNDQEDSENNEDGEERPVGTSDVVIPESVSTPEADPYQTVNPQGQTVYFWYFLPAQTPADTALNQVVDLFNETNPYDIFIDAYNQSTSSEIISRTFPLMNTVDVPGLIMTDPDIVFQLKDGLEDLAPLIDSQSVGFSSTEWENFNHQMITQAQYSGWSESLLAFPISRDVNVLYSNLDWLYQFGISTTPTTLNQVANTACLANTSSFLRAASENPTGIVLLPSLASFGTYTHSYNGTLYQPEGSTYSVNSQASIDAMSDLQQLSESDCLEANLTPDEIPIAFSQADSLYALTQSSQFSLVDSLVKANLSFTWDAIGLPAVETETTFPTILFGRNLSVPRSTPEQMVAAWVFIKYIQSSEAQRIWIQATGEYPLSRTIEANFPMPAAYWKIFNLLKDAPALPAYPLVAEVDQQVADAMLAILRGANVKNSLNLLQNRINRLTSDFYSTP